jgi:hypothetical protein
MVPDFSPVLIYPLLFSANDVFLLYHTIFLTHQKTCIWDGRVTQVREGLHSKHEALS